MFHSIMHNMETFILLIIKEKPKKCEYTVKNGLTIKGVYAILMVFDDITFHETFFTANGTGW
jgi:hypothetical protein